MLTHIHPDKLPKTASRILLLRSASMPVMCKAIQQIQKSWPSATLDIICQSGFEQEVSTYISQENIIPYPGTVFDTSTINQSLVSRIDALNCDLLIIPYSNNTGAEYENVHDFSLSLNIKPVIGFNQSGQWLYVDEHDETVHSNQSNNFKNIIRLKNIHQGQRAFILGMGPSLKISDLDLLGDEITFACNKIYLAFDSTEWRPTYYSVIDLLVAENNRTIIQTLSLPSVHCSNLEPILGNDGDITYIRSLKNPGPSENPDIQFSTDLTHGVFGGRTVLYFQMQLAFYMGIREIYLLGLDFNFDVPKTTANKTSQGETILLHTGEKNHFHPNYRSPGERWSMPKLDIQKKAFLRAREMMSENNGKIVNLSPGTKLDVFPCENLQDILAGGQQQTQPTMPNDS